MLYGKPRFVYVVCEVLSLHPQNCHYHEVSPVSGEDKGGLLNPQSCPYLAQNYNVVTTWQRGINRWWGFPVWPRYGRAGLLNSAEQLGCKGAQIDSQIVNHKTKPVSKYLHWRYERHWYWRILDIINMKNLETLRHTKISCFCTPIL